MKNKIILFMFVVLSVSLIGCNGSNEEIIAKSEYDAVASKLNEAEDNV